MLRRQSIQALEDKADFDVVIVGGGVNGACLYDRLCQSGHKVLLVEKGDFGSGTSQASGMMVWGGLLYLKNLDLPVVLQLSRDRDRVLKQKPEWMKAERLRFLPPVQGGRPKWMVHAILWLYWMMGLGHRKSPRLEDAFSEQSLIIPGSVRGSLSYEEGFLRDSDARFVYRWIAPPHRLPGQLALNYCSVDGSYSKRDHRWHLDLLDIESGKGIPVTSRMIVNCAGVWTDQVNARFGIVSPFRHALSKGVYMGIPRPEEHESLLVFDLGEHDDVITLVPWGPISLWGPTETTMQDISEGLSASRQDIDFLLEHYRRRFRRPLRAEDIVSLRCGIRPLVVNAGYRSNRYPLELSRRQEVIQDADRPWISCYGGKLTGCSRMASKVLNMLEKSVPATARPGVLDSSPHQPMEMAKFPGLAEPVVSATWSARHESCRTLDDYLRRRTNIAQWIPHGGFGRSNANADVLKQLALDIAGGDNARAEKMFSEYRKRVSTEFDTPLFG